MIRLTLPLILLAGPAFAAAGKPFFSLKNTDFVVSIGFLVFLGILVYFKVPQMLAGMLDKRADGIRRDLDEARAVREEAQTLLADYERRTRDARAQADDIVENARREARAAAEQARAKLDAQVSRRIAGAEDQIASAEAAAVKAVRDRAVQVATAAAAEVAAARIDAARADALIDRSIDTVREKLH